MQNTTKTHPTKSAARTASSRSDRDGICAGIAMAERMFMYSLATLLHSFDWKMRDGDKVDLTEKFGIVLKLKTSLLAIPTPSAQLPARRCFMPSVAHTSIEVSSLHSTLDSQPITIKET
ncbi:hypothetical protein Patl1_11285 [Pistacia atlantica]|uniref:Uncharacterized protein n=1 Tax=Pistacia atlantica TaxID=434234 RepID=A0ACC1A4N5_9ROSI|nr:hypothetical protein Patl1_11285 [Pistacia atlantica]